MDYKTFTEFLNHSREAKELLGTSSLLKDQTGDRLQTKGSYSGLGDKHRIGDDSKNFTNIPFNVAVFPRFKQILSKPVSLCRT